MKKTIIILAIIIGFIACKKESQSDPTKTKYFIKIVAVDNDGITQTESAYKTITITK